MRMNRQTDIRGIGTHLNRHANLGNEITCARSDDGATENAIGFRIEEKLGKAL